jgi:hypothetical protein
VVRKEAAGRFEPARRPGLGAPSTRQRTSQATNEPGKEDTHPYPAESARSGFEVVQPDPAETGPGATGSGPTRRLREPVRPVHRACSPLAILTRLTQDHGIGERSAAWNDALVGVFVTPVVSSTSFMTVGWQPG